ncbi:MAG: hydrolase [Sphingomonas bacterium]|uniref:NUDIX hydrolase n=1 Tax=Sphingomonas bacterium TaxID=1895847 RepID=UPI002610D1A8|nr:NUDIX hydrolase [Sphingomonas bacterium]MDB5696653.1 hydrolase [Sphingomonas bacterium]
MPDQPIPAATVVILRDTPTGPPEILMVERAKAMVFAGGALVFPGGRVDPGDRELAASLAGEGLGGDREDMAGRVAAIRETIEEAGLAIGLFPLPGPAALASLRAALHAGTSFREALAATGTTLDLDQLTPFARWLPAHAHMRIFDTQFYLARLPADAPAASVDDTENVRLLWATAAQVLTDADAGRVTIIYPTRRNLERLAQFANFDEAAAQANAIPVRTITPFVEQRDGQAHLCIPDGLGYPVTSEAMNSATRG